MLKEMLILTSNLVKIYHQNAINKKADLLLF